MIATDEQLAAEIEQLMRRDYWRRYSASEVAKAVGSTVKRVKRVLYADSRFREYAAVPKERRERFVEVGKPWATYCLWD